MENKTKELTLTPLQNMRAFFTRDDVKTKFNELLGKRSSAFVTSILQIVASNEMLTQAEPASVYHAAAVAATLDLPLNNALGFAYIVPYRIKQGDGSYKVVAQFQIGYKGFIQLALRSGQFRNISAAPIYEGQLVEENPLTGFVFDFKKRTGEKIIGYASFFQLLNGFEKTFYMTVDDMRKHGTAYSQSFKKGFGMWKDDFDVMALKTVLKLLLSKYAPLSIEMQKAVITDQGVIQDADTNDVTYVDNSEEDQAAVDKASERIGLMINDAKTQEELDAIAPHVRPEHTELFESKKKIVKFFSKPKKVA